jgi:hypothetical protein
LVFIIAVRVALPYILLKMVNKNLSTMKTYYGHVEDIDLAIIRGAYQIDSIYMNKKDSVTQKQTPFFAASLIDLSIEWKSLFHGSIVGEVVFTEPMLRFTKDKVEPSDVARDSTDLKELLDDLMPLRINRCEIRDGIVQYADELSKPRVDIQMTRLHLIAQNLTNGYDSTKVLPANIHATASVYEGTLRFDAGANPLASALTFDMSAELKNTNLVKLNDFFQAYSKVDVNKGRFGLYAEAAAKDGKFTGYIKPVIQDLDVLGKEDRGDNLLRKAWEGLVGVVGEVFENQSKDQLATKIPFRGDLDDPKTNIWFAMANILQNAFIRAIQPSIDNEISLGSVSEKNSDKKTFLRKIFSKDDKNEKSKKGNRKDKKHK